MLGWCAVILAVHVCTNGVLGSVFYGKRSDFSMYDNQFYRVGDTKLDDEVTDCAVVEHQFRKGYIRLREYLERKRGCGRKGKLKNIEGIAESTEDDINNDNIAEIAKSTTEDYHYPVSAMNKAPKPNTIPQVIKTYQSHKMAYVPHTVPAPVPVHARPAQHPAIQGAVTRDQAAKPSLNDYERKSQNLALSFEKNPQLTASKSGPRGQNTFQTESAQSETVSSAFNNDDQYTRLASGYDQFNAQPQHDLLQTFYPNTLQDRSQTRFTVAVGQPLYKKPTFSKTPTLKGAQVMPNKGSTFLKSAMKNFGYSALNKPVNVNTFNSAQVKPQTFNKPVIKPNNPDENIDDAHADMRDPEKDADDIDSGSIDQKPTPEAEIDDDQPVNGATNKPSMVPVGRRPGSELRPISPVSNSLSGFKKPNIQNISIVKGSPLLVKSPIKSAAPAVPSDFGSVNIPHPSINLEVLKNKIMHSTNATFLRRMLTLIQKITHHKDYQKLQGPARSFVAQANTAVQALNRANNERVSTTPVGFGNNNPLYENALRKKSSVQTLNAGYNNRFPMSSGNLGTINQLYGNNFALRKKSAVQALNSAYNNRVAMSTNLQGTGNQFYGNNYALVKKFQIERNPYYQSYYQYRQPYYRNILSMRYGLYNGNTP